MEVLKAEIRKLESRRYVILDSLRSDLLDHQLRLVRILCPKKVSVVCENEEAKIIVDAREFMCSECGIARRCLLRASVRGMIDVSDGVKCKRC
jgi:hypothetical protein